MDYYEESRYSVMKFAESHGINLSEIPVRLKEEIVHLFYKNYYNYEMDEEYAAQAAISEVISENNIELEGFEKWVP